MTTILKNITLRFIIEKRFRVYRNSLPKESEIISQKIQYDSLKDIIFWEDEGLTECHPNLAAAFLPVVRYRTNLILNLSNGKETEDLNKFDRQIFNISKKYFPDWIGFKKDRCIYNSETAEKIKSVRKKCNRLIKTLEYKTSANSRFAL